MLESHFKKLDRGDIVRHKIFNEVNYVVDANYGNRVTAVATVDITNPEEWELVQRNKVFYGSELMARITFELQRQLAEDTGLPLAEWRDYLVRLATEIMSDMHKDNIDPQIEDLDEFITAVLRKRGLIESGREYYRISGYYKDEPEQTFSDYLVTNYDDAEDENENVFFYGLSEQDIQEAIIMETQTVHDFVITDYSTDTMASWNSVANLGEMIYNNQGNLKEEEIIRLFTALRLPIESYEKELAPVAWGSQYLSSEERHDARLSFDYYYEKYLETLNK